MILQRLPSSFPDHSFHPGVTDDHYLCTETIRSSYRCHGLHVGPGILAMLHGSGKFKVNGVNYTLNEEVFMIVNYGSELSINLSERGATPVMLFFNTTLSDILIRGMLLNGDKDAGSFDNFALLEHIHYSNVSLRAHLALLVNLGSCCGSLHSLKADLAIRMLLDELIRENRKAIQVSKDLDVVKMSTRLDLYRKLTVAKAWIESCCNVNISLTQAATMARLHPQHFLRLFKKAFKITPHQYLIELRLKKAKRLLESTDRPVYEICNSVGFESLSSFSGLFKKWCGIAPSRVRKDLPVSHASGATCKN